MEQNVKAEAANLSRLFQDVNNRAQFARDYGVPGGGSMIYQHMQGLKPISLKAARAYARGFKCSLRDISTFHANEIGDNPSQYKAESPGAHRSFQQARKPSRERDELIFIINNMNDIGCAMLLMPARQLAPDYPLAQAKPAK